MPDWTPEQLEQWASGLPAAFEFEVRRAVSEGAELVQALAVANSSGPLSPADLIALDHPYARRHGSPQRDPGIINVLSGDFRAGWQQLGAQPVADGWQDGVHNTDPKADDLLAGRVRGRPLMFPRPVDEKTAVEAEPQVFARIERGIVEAIEP